MNILREITKGGKGKLLNRMPSSAEDIATMAPLALYEPNVETKKATFAMSWFWHPEALFGCAPGVIRTRVGYTGGTKLNPTYHNMGDHTESVDIDFDPNIVSYKQMIKLFWNHHDPTTRAKRQYMSAIFYHDEEQEALAKQTMENAKENGSRKITTVIAPAEEFYEAENYHQKFMLQQHPVLVTSIGMGNIIRSHVCARLNGYVSGNGKTSNFDQEWEKLGLNEKMAEYVRNKMTKHRF